MAGVLVSRRLKKMGAQRPRSRIYTGMAVVNLGLGLVVPMIDNAAHIGGLLTGIVVTIVLLDWENRLVQTNKKRARITVGLLACLFLGGLGLSFSDDFVRQRYEAAIASSESPAQVYYLSQLIRLDPQDAQARLKRLRLLLLFREFSLANEDFIALRDLGLEKSKWLALLDELRNVSEGSAGALWLQNKLADDLR